MSIYDYEPNLDPNKWAAPPLGEPDIVQKTEDNVRAFFDGLILTHVARPDTLFEGDTMPAFDIFRRYFLDGSVIAMGWPNENGALIAAGMLRADELDQVEIVGLYCVPEHEHTGFGRKLLAKMLQFVLEQGLFDITLDTFNSNQRATSLYHFAGFAAIGRSDIIKDATRMQLKGPDAIQQAIDTLHSKAK